MLWLKARPELKMPSLHDMSRVLYSHQWTSLDEWVSAVDCLADLSDGEIVDLLDTIAVPASPRLNTA